MDVYVCTYIHTYIHTHTHTYIHTINMYTKKQAKAQYTHTLSLSHTHTHIHIHTQTLTLTHNRHRLLGYKVMLRSSVRKTGRCVKVLSRVVMSVAKFVVNTFV
jgi:hypothetical protein